MKTSRMAWRNIWRNRRRTVVTVAAMTLTLLVTILYSGMVEGMLVNLEADTLDFEVGAVQVFARGYQDNPSLYRRIDDADEVVRKLGESGLAAAPRLLGAGLAASGEFSAGGQIRGLDVARDGKVLVLGEQVAAGEWLDELDPRGVVVGRKLARTLGAAPGAELILLSQAADGGIANDLYRVRGVLRSVGEVTDRSGVFMSAAAFRDLMTLEGGAHQIIVRRPRQMTLDETAAAVRAAAPDRDVQTWKEIIPALATMVESTRGLIQFVFLIFNVVVSIVILNAMLMAVFERINEIGVLKALGAVPAGVLKLIYLESMMQVGLAILAGLAVSVPALWYLAAVGIDMRSIAGVSVMGMAMMSQWKAVVAPHVYAGPVFMLVVVVSIAVLYPSAKAALISPLEAMRHR
jgi:ABC-type lipoprotein release transport system permease subunit